MFVARPPSILELVQRLGSKAVVTTLERPPDLELEDRYLHWDRLRHLAPPDGMTTDEWWLKIKWARQARRRALPLVNSDWQSFGYGLTDPMLRGLHRIDQRCAGEIAMDEVVTSERRAGQRFLVNSLMEEAIRSSQLEGATTSRRIAKEMLRNGRAPNDRSERMIANNYRALQFMRESIGQELRPEAVLELHRIVAEGTLRNPDAAGRLQRPGEERVAVFDRDEEPPIHRPPPADQLPERMQLLCDFANQGESDEPFVHPVVRAILLHFWLAHDHPFEDGNGRTARILFFWLMRTRGYWLAEYLPISRILRAAPAKYARSFLEAETDEGDTTYFLIAQLKVIEQAIDELHQYLQRKIVEVRDIEQMLHGVDCLNGRQLALLTDAVRHPDAAYSFDSHATSHRVTHETARSDLYGLADLGLLSRRQQGRRYLFEPAPNIAKRLKESPS